MKRKNILFLLCFFLLLSFMIFRIWHINKTYPEPNVETYLQGETLKTQSFEITLDNWKFYSQTESEQILKNNHISDAVPNAQKKIFCTKLSIKNIENKVNFIDITNFAFESLAWHNQWDMELFYALNDITTMTIELEPGEICNVTLPIILYDFQFKTHIWDGINQRTFYLVISFYPVKRVFTNC